MTTTQRLQRLRADRTSGATILGESAIDTVEEFIATQQPQEPQEFSAALEKLAREILMAQPSMAVMLNLAQCVLEACLEEASFLHMKQRVQQALSEYRQTLRQSMEVLCGGAIEILPRRATVLTYSNSTTVSAVLHHARAKGHLDRVFLSEARPAYDGRALARSLAEVGVAIEYSTDMGLFAKLREADLVVLGADAVFPTYFLNKIGTYALAELAQVRDVPCFALCAANKFLPAAAAGMLRISKHSGDEVWAACAPGVRVHNHYFEEIPLSLLDGVVSDQGVHSPERIRMMLDERPLPPALLRLRTEPTSPDEPCTIRGET
jgi:translation initiation factor 2B subunit (eIF-2B alpha/beta/delta family)